MNISSNLLNPIALAGFSEMQRLSPVSLGALHAILMGCFGTVMMMLLLSLLLLS